jgi:soluble lytic murein transglycosylase-like protein
MDRARVAVLACLAAFLVLHDPQGEADLRPRGPAAPRGAASVRGPDAAVVAAYFREVNPALSDAQTRRIAAAVVKYSEKYRLDPALVVGVIEKESAARPWVRSSKGAVGLMQVMPQMLGSLDVAGNAMSIETNIEAGCIILADNIRRLGEDEGILAYFWGNEIRGGAYLRRVQAARAAFRRRTEEAES